MTEKQEPPTPAQSMERIAIALEKLVAWAESGGSSRPQPQPKYPGGACPVHGEDWKWVPPGTSKTTSKPYAGFWTCPERGCRERPGASQGGDHRGREYGW